MPLITILTANIVLATYAGVAVGRVPGLKMNRATIALVGIVWLSVIH